MNESYYCIHELLCKKQKNVFKIFWPFINFSEHQFLFITIILPTSLRLHSHLSDVLAFLSLFQHASIGQPIHLKLLPYK